MQRRHRGRTAIATQVRSRHVNRFVNNEAASQARVDELKAMQRQGTLAAHCDDVLRRELGD